MRKFIILGCGYLGTNIANYISEKDAEEVYVMGIENEYNDYLNSNVIFISRRIEEIDEEDAVLFSNSIVIDAVGNTNAADSVKSSSTLFLHNCMAKIEMLSLIQRFNIKKYIFLSSGGTVYDDSNKLHKEDESISPKSLYALEKMIEENYLNIQGIEANVLPYLVLRLSNPYGGVVSKHKKQGIIDVVINKLINDEEIELFGKLTNTRDYIYIDDVAEAIYRLAISNFTNSIYNVGTGVGTTLRELFDVIENTFNKKIKLIEREGTTFNINSNVLDITKMLNDIDFMPETTIADGIAIIKKVRLG